MKPGQMRVPDVQTLSDVLVELKRQVELAERALQHHRAQGNEGLVMYAKGGGDKLRLAIAMLEKVNG